MGLQTWRTMRGAGALGMVLLQLVAGAALPSADALLEAERTGLELHVESPHNEDCPAAHDHLVCQVVRSLAAAAGKDGFGTRLDLPRPPAYDRPDPSGDHVEHRPSVRGPTLPRPPPLG